MVTKEKAKIILEDGGTETYTDEEVNQIREYLFKMAEVAFNSYQQEGNGRKDEEKL